MQITCPQCQHIFFATTRHAVCDRCGASFDVWAMLGATSSETFRQTAPLAPPPDSGLSDEVLELPAQTPLGEQALESAPVLDESFSALPSDPYQPQTEASPDAVETGMSESDGEDRAQPLPGRVWRWAAALLALVVAGAAIYYLLGALRSSSEGEALPAVAAATGGQAGSGREASAPASDGAGAQSPARSESESEAKARTATPPAPRSAAPAPATGAEAPASRPRIVTPPGGRASNFTLQVAARAQEAEARRIAERLREAGEEARVVRAEIPGRGLWYRVQVGAFETREEAERRGAQLKRAGTIDDFFVADLRPRDRSEGR